MYTVDEFLDKNRETLRDEHLELLMGADNSFVAMSMDVFEDRKAGSPAGNSTKRANVSLCSNFKTQLTSLVNTLTSTGANFIKCIKPNEDKAPRVFNSPMCYRQLRNTGVMDVIKILTMGYTSRIPLAEFSSRYCVMLSETPKEVWQGKKDPVTGGPHYAHACRRVISKIVESGSSNWFPMTLPPRPCAPCPDSIVSPLPQHMSARHYAPFCAPPPPPKVF
jgi:myosin heavy subunit